MAEFLEQGVKFEMGGGAEKVLEDPTERFLGFDGGGFELQEVLDVAALVALKGGTEFEQDESGSADEANLEVLAVFPCVEALPETGRQQGEVEAMERGGPIEPVRIEAEFRGDFGGGLFHRIGQGVGADDVAFPFAQGHDIDVLGGAGAQALRQQGTAAADDQPDGCGGPIGEEFAEEMECFGEVVLIHEILFRHPNRMCKQYL